MKIERFCPGSNPIWLWGVLIFLIISCSAPQQITTQMIPEAPEGRFEHGREYITLAADSIDAILGFDGIHDRVLIFDFVLHNRSNSPVSFSSSDFYYEILDSAMALQSSLPSVNAITPDDVSEKYDKTIRDLLENKQFNTLFGIMEATAGIIYNTSNFIATDNPGFIFDLIAGTITTADHYLTVDREIEKEIHVMSEEKTMVSQSSHGVTVVEPGQSVSGFVFFPQDLDARYYMFCFPIHDELFQFVYRQRFSYQM
jgi:hypothetical protein